MDQHQNYEYNDPNAFGYINSFPGNDNYMLGQPQQGQQQLNGKDHSHAPAMPQMAPMQGFDADAAQFNAQPNPMTYQLSDPTAAPQFAPPQMDFRNMAQAQTDLSLNSQKDAMFNMVNPTAAVPADIIQQPQPINTQLEESSHLVETQPSVNLEDTPSLSTGPEESSLSHQIDLTVDQPKLLDTPPAADLCEKPSSSSVVFSPEQNNMMKALGVVRKEVLAPAAGLKKRRRILQLNQDDSDDDNELKKQLLESPEKEKEKPGSDADTEDSSADSASDDNCANDPGALRARFLLKSAVIIQGPDSKKKKKKRVLESDDEDEMLTSVDDIGMVDENEMDNDDLLSNDIIVGEPDFGLMDEEEKIVEDSYVPQDEFAVPEPPAPLEPVKDDKENPTESEVKPAESKENVETENIEAPTSMKTESEETGIDDKDDESRSIIKNEDGEIDPSMSVEAILENIKPMADDDEFFKVGHKSEDSDCQFVDNEKYFGTPDLSKTKPKFSRKRGPKPGMKRKPRQESGQRKRGNKYEKDFVDGSSESEDTTYSESESSSSDSSNEVAQKRGRPPVYKKSPTIVQTKSFSVTKVPLKKKITNKDRFYDRSRDIPNDVYFGDVNVPLNVLHTRWDSDAASDSSDQEVYHRSKPTSLNRFIASNSSRPSFNYIEPNDDPKLSNLKEFARISGIKINFTRLFDGIRSTDDKCVLIRRILAQKGLQGEPTVAKCRQLKLDLQAKRESAELDKSVIIRAEGRRRVTRNVSSRNSSHPSTSNPVVQPETLQTLSKIRRVVDSESDD